MEIINTLSNKKIWFLWKNLATTALCCTLIFWSTSCWKPTQKDINQQKQKVESLSFQVSHYIYARKDFVNQYNKLLKYPKSESNKYQIDNSLSQLLDIINDYDKKIEQLSKDKVNAQKNLNDKIKNSHIPWENHSSIDPNKRDFLLKIQ